MKMLYVFSEEASMKAVLDVIIPKIVQDVPYRIFIHQGKQDLEKALKTAVPSVSKMPGARILIIRDQDSGDCEEIKRSLIDIVGENCACPVLFRIVCRELECWFLGDPDAIEQAFPRFKARQHKNKKLFRNVDSIPNAPQILLKMIPDYKDRTYLPKMETAKRIALMMHIDSNKSLSFRHVLTGIQKLIS